MEDLLKPDEIVEFDEKDMNQNELEELKKELGLTETEELGEETLKELTNNKGEDEDEQ